MTIIPTLQSTSSATVDENGLRHFRMEAETGMLGLTGSSIGEEDDRSSNADLPEPFVPDGISEGIYSNMAYIRTNGDEVVLDFARIAPDSDPNRHRPMVKARIVLTPGGALALAEMLRDKLSPS